MRRRQRPNVLILLSLACGFLLIGILLLIGFLLWDYWQSLPDWGRLSTAAAVIIGLLGTLGVAIFWRQYRRRVRTAAWNRAIDAWKNNQNSPQAYHSVRQFSPKDLERFAAQVYENMGYQVVHTGRSGDHGVDVRLVNPAGETEIVQCKQWKSLVGEPEVRNFVGAMVHEQAVRGFIWAPGGFTPEARRWASGKPVILADDQEIARIVISSYSS